MKRNQGNTGASITETTTRVIRSIPKSKNLSASIRSYIQDGEPFRELPELKYSIRLAKQRGGRFSTISGARYDTIKDITDIIAGDFGSGRYMIYMEAVDSEGKDYFDKIEVDLISQNEVNAGPVTMTPGRGIDDDAMAERDRQHQLELKRIEASTNLAIAQMQEQNKVTMAMLSMKMGGGNGGASSKDILAAVQLGTQLAGDGGGGEGDGGGGMNPLVQMLLPLIMEGIKAAPQQAAQLPPGTSPVNTQPTNGVPEKREGRPGGKGKTPTDKNK